MSTNNLAPLDPNKGNWDEKALTRRQFLEVTFWAVTGVAAVGTLGSGARFLAGNSLEPRTANWVQLGSLSDLAPGPVHRVDYAMKARDAWRDVEQKGTLYAFSTDGVKAGIRSPEKAVWKVR